MRLSALRRGLRANPRTMLVVLLAFAFAIEIAPPPSAVVQHRHAHGDGPQVHAGRIVVARTDSATAGGAGSAATGLRAAPARGLHRHLTPPSVVGAMPAIVPAVPPPLVVPVPPFVAEDERPVALLPGRAQSPTRPA